LFSLTLHLIISSLFLSLNIDVLCILCWTVLVWTIKIVSDSHFISTPISKGTFGTNMKTMEITTSNSVIVKNNVFFTRNVSTIIPAKGDITIFIINIIVIMIPYVIIEYPNCFAIVGKNPIRGPKPVRNEKIN